MTDGQLFPHFVCRVAGVPVGCLEDLAAVESMTAYRALRESEVALGQLRGPLSEALFEAVGGLEDKSLRRALLRLKRDVHNLRPLDRLFPDRVRDAVSRSMVRDLERYDECTRSLRQAEAHFEVCFEVELTRIRHRFQDAVTDEDFRNGLLFASSTLFDEVDRYLRAPVQRPRAKVRQVERSLLRYYTRTAVKTTPFSTFCATIPGRFHRGPSQGAPGFVGDPREKSSVLRLNKAMYPFLVQALTARPAVRRHLCVELNPTLRRVDGRWFFLTGADRREVFQHLTPNPVLGLLQDVLSERDRLPLAVLAEMLRKDVDASEEQVFAYLDRLLEVGFLRFRLGIREQEVDWDRCLCRLVAGVEDDHARRTVRFLREYRRKADAYAKAPLERRRALLGSLSGLVDGYFESVETEGWIPGTATLFEDAGSHASLVLDLGDLGDLAAEYVRLTRPFIWILGEQANMRHFFTERYGPDPVPLLRFYEDYYQEHLKGELERQEQFWGEPSEGAEEKQERATFEELVNPFRLEVVGKLNGARRGLEKRIRELWRAAPSAEEIVLERRDLEEVAAGLPDLDEPCRSVSLFVQYVPGLARGDDNGESRDGLVLDSYLIGFGKYFSRFLYLLPEEVEKDLVASNQRLAQGELAEICGDASFNADLHPPLLPEEITYPTAEGGTAREQISVSDLVVEPDPQRPFRLRLVNATTGREVIPVDLGFRNPRMRPLLFQLLSRMTPASAFLLNVPQYLEEPEDVDPGATGHVVYRPRVSYRGRLVLARRRWTLPQALFPGRDRRESETDHFLRIQRWREEMGLPEEVFVRILHSEGEREATPGKTSPGKTPPGKTPGIREHLGKPQYIDFHNPLLVDLLSRMTENLERFQVILEERLPGRDQLISRGEERFVTEIILQVDFPEEA